MTSTEVEHNDSETSVKSEEVFLGRIKWFNNKSGDGFITITDGIRAGNDIFVHHSGIIVSNEQYKCNNIGKSCENLPRRYIWIVCSLS